MSEQQPNAVDWRMVRRDQVRFIETLWRNWHEAATTQEVGMETMRFTSPTSSRAPESGHSAPRDGHVVPREQ